MTWEGGRVGSISNFLANMNWESLVDTLLTAVAALLCLTVHELCHGAVAYRLGDPTAKNAGRLTLNPIRHIDPLGLLLLITAHVGWAKPVPVDPRYFKDPKRGMALTALAGPVSNFLLAWLFLLLSNGLWRLVPGLILGGATPLAWGLHYLASFLLNAAILSVGLGVFNLFPIPPLDGSKVLFAFLPDHIYHTILRYERFIMPLMLAAVWFGLLDKPLTFLIARVTNFLGVLSAFPYPVFPILP